MGRIRTVVLVSFPQAEGEGLQEGFREGVRDMVRLGFGAQLGKVEVLAAQAWPVAWEESGVGACRLSIKLNGQGVDGDGDVQVKEALHTKRPCKQGGLGKIFVLCQGQEGAVKVPIRNENECGSTRVGSKGEDTRNGSFCGSKCAIVASAKTALDACAIGEGEEGGDKVVRVRDWVDVDGVVVGGWVVREVDDSLRTCWRCWGGESGEYSGMGPSKTSRDAEYRKGGG